MDKALKEKWKELCATLNISRRGTPGEYSRTYKAFLLANDPQWKEREQKYKRKLYEKNKDRKRELKRIEYITKGGRDKTRVRKAKQRATNPERLREWQRDWYSRNSAKVRQAVKLYKYNRNPAIGVRKLLDSYLRGECQFDEIAARLGKALVHIDDELNKCYGYLEGSGGGTVDTSRESEAGGGLCEGD